jgi:surface polysaccharide O-acyltransferase-like enzyme
MVMNLAAYGISVCLQIYRGASLGEIHWLKEIFLAILPNNYYVILYIGVYLVARYINIIFETLKEKKNLRRMLILLIFLFSVEPTLVDWLSLITKDSLAGLSMISISGSQSGYNITTFLLMYCVGAYIRYTNMEKMWNMKKSLIGYFVCVFVNVLLCLPQSIFHIESTGLAWAYSSPFVIGEAIFLFLFFMNLSMGQSKPVNQLSRASFMVYLCHNWFIPYIGVSRFVQGNVGVLLLHLVISLVVIYCLCWVIYIVYANIEKRVIN